MSDNKTTPQDNTNNNDNAMSWLEKIMNRNILKYQVGQQMFCPRCQGVMDFRRAVGADIYIQKGDDKDTKKLLSSHAWCTACWDNPVYKEYVTALARLATKATNAGSDMVFTLTTIDGRNLR